MWKKLPNIICRAWFAYRVKISVDWTVPDDKKLQDFEHFRYRHPHKCFIENALEEYCHATDIWSLDIIKTLNSFAESLEAKLHFSSLDLSHRVFCKRERSDCRFFFQMKTALTFRTVLSFFLFQVNITLFFHFFRSQTLVQHTQEVDRVYDRHGSRSSDCVIRKNRFQIWKERSSLNLRGMAPYAVACKTIGALCKHESTPNVF